MNKLEEELATMKIMIYSLHSSINDIVKAVSGEEIVPIEEWEKECKKIAKMSLESQEKKEGNEENVSR